METVQLVRVCSGKYQTQDGRFTVTRKRYTATWWLIEDSRGRLRKAACDHDTLKSARERIAVQIEDERNATA